MSIPSERAWSTLWGSYGSPRRNIWPVSCFSKPQMIFISVDLPAPLSPSRPSTSPFLRVMSMPAQRLDGAEALAHVLDAQDLVSHLRTPVLTRPTYVLAAIAMMIAIPR